MNAKQSSIMRVQLNRSGLEQARQLYRQQIACVHPDKPGGSLEQAVQLNLAWGRIERHFKNHGHELW
jgi:hypothetical protein